MLSLLLYQHQTGVGCIMDIQKKDFIIKRSHDRSKAFGIAPERKFPKHILQGSALEQYMERNKELMNVAQPIMEQLMETLEPTGFIVVLTDNEGCILSVKGGKQTLNAARDLNMVAGAFMSEQSIGTNAMGTAISEDAAVQITATEHFISVYHQWTCSAAPIHYNGTIIGTLNLTGKAENVHPHTLGLVMAGVDAIENKLLSNRVQRELRASNNYAWAMMNNLAYGVFAIDMNDEIQWVNNTACRIINIRRKELVEKPIETLLPDWKKIKRIILNELNFLDQDSSFALKEVAERFLFNAYLIKNEQSEILGYLISFRPLSRMLNLVKKYSGLHAHHAFSDIITRSPKMEQLITYAKNVATSPSTVLITGDSGTGKEVFAQAIHNSSERRDAAFVAVNCGAISPTLIESEIFGYEEGAFTGAKKGGRPGKFELANEGTIFLDEIGEMPMDMQVKLLRVLQEGSLTRLGGQNSVRIDVRVIAATNKNLQKEIDSGKFRLDLFYRLNVIPLHIPSLKDRIEDVVPLARHFIAQKGAKLNKPVPELTRQIIEKMTHYDWPGNVRELENYVEKLVNLGGDPSFSDTPPYSVTPVGSAPENQNAKPAYHEIQSLEEVEKEAIKYALKAFEGNISQMAKRLKVGRNTLYTKLKKYGIDPKHYSPKD